MIRNLPLEKIRPNPWNCNLLPNPEKKKLKKQMEKLGPEKIQPIITRKLGDIYEIIDGEQRWSIAKELGWKTVPVVVFEDISEDKAKNLTLSYNKLKGSINWFKLHEILNKEKPAIVGELLSEEETRQVMKLGNIVEEAKKTILDFVEANGWCGITLEHLAILADYPKSHQTIAAKSLVENKLGVGNLLQGLEELLSSRIEEEEFEKEKVKLEGEAEVEKERKKLKEEREVVLTPIEKNYTCPKCKQPFIINFQEPSLNFTYPSQQGLKQLTMKLNFIDRMVKTVCSKCGLELVVDYNCKRITYPRETGIHHELEEKTAKYKARCICGREYVVTFKTREIKCKCGWRGKPDIERKTILWIGP